MNIGFKVVAFAYQLNKSEVSVMQKRGLKCVEVVLKITPPVYTETFVTISASK